MASAAYGRKAVWVFINALLFLILDVFYSFFLLLTLIRIVCQSFNWHFNPKVCRSCVFSVIVFSCYKWRVSIRVGHYIQAWFYECLSSSLVSTQIHIHQFINTCLINKSLRYSQSLFYSPGEGFIEYHEHIQHALHLHTVQKMLCHQHFN